MKKRRLFKILSKADRGIVLDMADEIKKRTEVVVIKAPEKALAMIKMREPVKESLFYLGEVIVTETTVSVNGVNGTAVAMGDDYDKTLAMAIIDAAYNGNLFADETVLLELEKEQIAREEKENAMFMKTMVNFKSMDSGEPV
ncbi:MAG: phosphonate C-P lyase system protein PhnG [Peptococcaceae bacterium]|nr:phosphonate C-P lyase system protein PhnG [Peptococcaceae bacterium]